MNDKSLLERLVRPNILALEAYRSARSENLMGEYWMDANELPWTGNLLSDGEADNRYPMPQPFSLMDALASFYAVEAPQLLVTRGVDEGIDVLIRTFCEGPSDKILSVEPSYGLYQVSAALQNCRYETVALDEEAGFSLRSQTLIDRIDEDTKIIILCNPNNPTGNLLSRESIDAVIEAARDRCLVLIDEAYIEFSEEASVLDRLVSCPHVVVMRTFSKAWGLAGLRIGVTIAHASIIALLRKVLAPYPLSSPSLRALKERLSEAGVQELWRSTTAITALREELGYSLNLIPQIKRVLPSSTNFLLVEVKDAKSLVHALRTKGFSVRERSSLKRSYVRISIGTAQENRALVAKLKEILR